MFGLAVRSASIGLALAAASMAPAFAQVASGAKYVSMGSSYAAGPGVGVLDKASGPCARSLSNYAHQLAERHRLDLVDVSCSGATTSNILSHGQYGAVPEIEAVDSRTRLVTVTIGGNDVNYVKNLMSYACRDTGGACSVVPDAEVDQEFIGLPNALRQVIAEVRRRAPQALVVVIDYLPVIPDAVPCAAIALNQEDAARMRAVLARVQQSIDGAAEDTHTPLVRASAIGAGHDACSADPYIAGYKPAPSSGWPFPVPFHPNQKGMDRLADAIDEEVSRETAP